MLAGLHRACTAKQAAAALDRARAELRESVGMSGGKPWGKPDLGFGLVAMTGRDDEGVYWIAVTDGERDVAIRARASYGWAGDGEAAVARVREISHGIPHSDDRLAVLVERDPTLTLS